MMYARRFWAACIQSVVRSADGECTARPQPAVVKHVGDMHDEVVRGHEVQILTAGRRHADVACMGQAAVGLMDDAHPVVALHTGVAYGRASVQ